MKRFLNWVRRNKRALAVVGLLAGIPAAGPVLEAVDAIAADIERQEQVKGDPGAE